MLGKVEGFIEEKNGIKYLVFDFCFLSKLSTIYILTNRTIKYTYTYIYKIYVYIYTYTQICICTFVYIYMHTYTHIGIRLDDT